MKVLFYIAVFLVSVTRLVAGEFPIGIYHEPWSFWKFQDPVHRDSAFARLDAFGANFASGLPDSVFRRADSLYSIASVYATYGHQYAPGGAYTPRSAPISQQEPTDFSGFLLNSVYYPYAAGNCNAQANHDGGWGYVFESGGLVGSQFQEADGRYVRRAIASAHNAGYLLGSFFWWSPLKGIDKAYGDYLGYHTRIKLRADYHIKLESRPTDTALAVARIEIVNRDAYDARYISSTYDTLAKCDTCFKKPLELCLLIANDADLGKLFIDTSLNPPCTVLARNAGPCMTFLNDTLVVANGGQTYRLNGTYPQDTSFYVPNFGTVSGIPDKMLWDLYSRDFVTTGQYITIPYNYVTGRAVYLPKFYFYDAAGSAVYLDSIKVTNDTARAFQALNAATANSMLVSHLQSLSGQSGYYPKYWYVQDEPWSTFANYTKVNQIVRSGQVMGHFTTAFTEPQIEVPSGQDTTWRKDSLSMPTYFKYMTANNTELDHVTMEMYLTPSSCDSASGDGASVFDPQFHWKKVAATFNRRKRTVDSLNHIYGSDAALWAILGTFGWCDADKGWIKREPTPTECKLHAYMALVYGAKGIWYYSYISTREGQPFQTPDYITGLASSQSFQRGFCPYEEHQRGLTTWNGDELQYTPQWDSCRSANQKIQSMGDILLGLTWKGAGPSTIASSIDGSFVNSVNGSVTPSWIETGFFEDSVGNQYLMLVNRRSLATESQSVKVVVPAFGYSTLTDISTQVAYSAFDSLGVTTINVPLPPGEMALLKWQNQSTFKGTWAGTWPQYSTIKVVGDVTVPSGQTLTIRTPISVKANTDSLGSGYSSTKSEMIVSGTLRFEGTSSNRLTLQPDQALDSSWYGIRVNYGGKLVADNVIIKKAYSGLYLNGTADTVKNSRIEDCFMHGVYSEGGPFYLDHDTLISHNTDVSEDSIVYGMRYGVRVLGDDNSTGPTITNSYFTNAKYPIELFWCRSKITNTTIRRSGLYQSLGKGTPAINLGRYANVDSIYNCSIQNYKYGVKAGGSRSNSLVQRCEIGSDLFRDVQHPYMYIGVHADSGYLANCKLRSNCFKGVEQYHIFRRWTLVDAGTASNFGHNNFFVDTVRVHPPCTIPVTMDTIPDSVATCAFYRYPEVVIYNVSGATVDARGNYWAEFYYYPRKTGGNTLADNIYGPVDTLSPYIVPDLFCESGPPPDIKVVVDSADEGPKSSFSVEQNYPNPFNPTTEIRFTLPKSEHVTIEVFNVLGQRIAVLADGDLPSGDHIVRWDGEDDSGERVASGIYLYRVVAGENRITKKMLMLK